jgi:hypothetical protein
VKRAVYWQQAFTMPTVSHQRQHIQTVARQLQQLPQGKAAPASTVAVNVVLALQVSQASLGYDQQPRQKKKQQASACAALQAAGWLAAAVQAAPDHGNSTITAAIYACLTAAANWLLDRGSGSVYMDIDLAPLLHPEPSSVSPGRAQYAIKVFL